MAGTGKSITLNLYVLERIDTVYNDEWAGCLVAATSESSARQIANEESKAEGYVWTDAGRTNARKIGVADDGVQGVVLHATA